MLYAAIAIVCLSGVPVTDCNKDTAVLVQPLPEDRMGLASCFAYAQQYAADAGMIGEGQYLKTYCRPAGPMGVFG